MPREVNADELHSLLAFVHNRREADRICPSVAEPEHPKPSEPVIDEAVYEAAGSHPVDAPSGWRGSITAAVLKDRELRSNSGGTAPGLVAPSTEGCRAESKPLGTGAAHAADTRRLTDEELRYLWNSEPLTRDGLRAVAAAQLAKAKVTISEAEVTRFATAGGQHVLTLIVWLKAHGVEVLGKGEA